MHHLGTKRIETERLILRPFRPSDAEDMYRNWARDPEVTKYLTWQPHESVEASHAIAAMWERESRKPEFYQWAIELKELSQPIGSISVVGMDEQVDAMELGYCIGRPWWGQGLTAEATRAVIAYLLREVGANRVSARHNVNNPASGRVMQKAGMRREGILRRTIRDNQGIADAAVYSILADEWNETI